jgi:hypothetical protein
MANHELVISNAFGYHGARSYKGERPDVKTTDNSGVRADGGAMPHRRFCVLIPPVNRAPWIDHIGKHHRRPQKYVILADHPGVYRNIVLYFTLLPGTTSGDTTTFCPILQFRPVVQFGIICEKFQILVMSPYLATFTDDGRRRRKVSFFLHQKSVKFVDFLAYMNADSSPSISG